MQERSVRPRSGRREPPRSASTFRSRQQRVVRRESSRALLVAACLSSGAIAGWARAAEGEAASNEAKAPVSGGGAHGALAMAEQQQALATLIGPVKPVSAPAGVNAEFWQSLAPKDNPGTDAQVALGRKLYFDTRLSRDGSVACATCHDVSRGFSDHRNTSEGIGDQIGRRNAPPTMNAAFYETQFWDGRAATLEDQAKLPIVNPIEMGMPDGKAAAAAIAADAEYQAAFQAAYGRQPNYEDIGRALAAFERTLIFLSAPFDRFARGEVNAISADARAGFALFNGKARCNACHQMSSSRPLGTDNRFHNIGVSARHQNFEELAKRGLAAIAKDDSVESIDRLALETDLAELGRFVVTRSRADVGAFKTSQVRNVGVTAPYMHDGTLQTLWDVVDHYNKGGEANPYLDGGIEPLALTEQEVDQVVAFLFTLTDDRLAQQNDAEFSRQKAIAAERRPFRDTSLTQREVLPFERLLKGRTQ
jgi:cytochrome c peroxidase